MTKLIKMIKALMAKGFATSAEKAQVQALFKELGADEQEAVKEDADKVAGLDETDPADKTAEDEVAKGLKALLSAEAKSIRTDLVAELKAYLDEQKDLMAKKAGVYNPEIKADRSKLNGYVRELAKALYASNDSKVKEMTTDASGSPYSGYTVDAELSAEIRHLVTEYGVARREMTAIQLTKNSYKANDLATDVTCFWVDEAGSIRSTEAVLGQEELTLKKLAVVVSMTSELMEDTEIDFVSFIGSRVAEGFAKMEDEAFFKGDGTSTYASFTGLLEATDVNEVELTGTTFASMDADDLLDMIDKTPSGALKNAKFYMNRTIMSIVRKLKDENNAYIYQPLSASGPSTIWGYPVVLVEAMPGITATAAETSFVLFGDLKKACILGYKGAIKVAKFNAGTIRNVANNADINLITTDREAVRWTNRVGYIRIIPTAVTKLTTAEASA